MGLDGVELILATEDAFGIRIEDEEAADCLHPRDVIDLVWEKVTHSTDRRCPSQRAFYITRRALVECFGVSRKSVVPDAPLAHYIPAENQPESWELLRAAIGARIWPDLKRPNWINAVNAAAVMSVFAVLLLWAVLAYSEFLVICSVLAAFAVSRIMIFVTNPWKNRIPIYEKSVKDLMKLTYSSGQMQWTREGVAELFKEIVMEQLSVSEEQYSEDAHFVKDYGV